MIVKQLRLVRFIIDGSIAIGITKLLQSHKKRVKLHPEIKLMLLKKNKSVIKNTSSLIKPNFMYKPDPLFSFS